jgi:perosamine synthetase
MMISEVVNRISSIVDGHERPVLLHAPSLPETCWTYVRECLDTGWISSAGAYVDRLEGELAKATGVLRAVATVNGTAALQTALTLAGVRAGDEVLAPSLTFVATANAIRYCGAEPHFVDVDPARFAVHPEKLSHYLASIAHISSGVCMNRHNGRPIRAVCVMHCFGHPADLDALLEVCEQFHLILVEDAAESLGSYYKGRHTGFRGLVSAVSFNGNKILSTGGGGAVLTNDPDIGSRAKHLTTTAKVTHPWESVHDEVGWNFRMPNINAALGFAQLQILPQMIAAKRALAATYIDSLKDIPGISVLAEPADSRSNYWLNTLVLDPQCAGQRDALLESLNAAGLQSRALWRPMHQLPMYANSPRADLSVTEDLSRRVVNIPSSAHLAPGWPAAFATVTASQFRT